MQKYAAEQGLTNHARFVDYQHSQKYKTCAIPMMNVFFEIFFWKNYLLQSRQWVADTEWDEDEQADQSNDDEPTTSNTIYDNYQPSTSSATYDHATSSNSGLINK